jgi:outer membrane lipoprotein-sorting protein
MRKVLPRFACASLLIVSANTALAQTAEEIVEKLVAASGGRAAFAKLKSRLTTGTITLSTPAGDVSGTVEILNAAPNKSRSLIKADLSALGAGLFVLDQRFNGTSGYVLDSLQGNHEMTGNLLDNMRNNAFPNVFLTYKEMGAFVRLVGREKVGERDAYVITLEPPTGSVVRQYVDAQTYLPIKMSVKVEVPQLGQLVEQTTEFFDFQVVDGIKLAFQLRATSAIQNYTITITSVEHNVQVDEALFSKPPAP